MVMRAEIQKARGMRDDVVMFRPIVMTHTGEMPKDVFETIEDFAGEARAICKVHPSPIGIKPIMAAAASRTRIKDQLASAMAQGFGDMLSAVGFPTNSQVREGDVAY
jgi:hypothetical protein